MRFKPVALRRKVIEITPELVILWSGDFNAAHSLAIRAKEWFKSPHITDAQIQTFLETFYKYPTPNFHSIIAPATDNWFYVMGNVQKENRRRMGNMP
jgi:hypothetical protein